MTDKTDRARTVTDGPSGRYRSRWVGAALWVIAVAVMLAAATYQRRTGPTYPYEGYIVLAGDSSECALMRSEETTREARVEISLPRTLTRSPIKSTPIPDPRVHQRCDRRNG